MIHISLQCQLCDLEATPMYCAQMSGTLLRQHGYPGAADVASLARGADGAQSCSLSIK